MAYLSHSPLIIAQGGTGVVSFTTYAPIVGGTTSTGAVQQATTNFANPGWVLTSTGSSSLPTWQEVPGSVVTITPVDFGDTPYTVLAFDQFLSVDSTGGAISILLEDAPAVGRVVIIKDSTGTAVGANSMTITTVGGAVLVDGATTFTMNSAYQAINVVFDGSKYLVY